MELKKAMDKFNELPEELDDAKAIKNRIHRAYIEVVSAEAEFKELLKMSSTGDM